MMPALGRALILASLVCAAAGTVIAFAAGRWGSPAAAAWTRRLAYGFAAAMVLANALMVWALLSHDFSVSYVAQVGSRASPAWVSVVSLWSSLEGSILFWGAVLGAFIAVATRTVSRTDPDLLPNAAGVWLACATFFALLLAGPAQPFHTVSPVPPDGPGPNPLLQNHVLMAIHPPMLYLGYVGMTIPFGLACAALMAGRLGPSILRPLRTALMFPWVFLSMAIVLGGWWAYEVLGWGGYWAWDPVENASLLPWLTATAALHSAILTERRGILKGWTLTLIMATFLLTILGTFMTRSGVFNSVHSFTQSAIGPTLLGFLAAALVFSVALLALRVDLLTSEGRIASAASREGAFLVNNLLLVLFTFTVLLGTVFPLVVEAAKGVQMSVGRPYFDRMAVPLGTALLFLMGVGPALPWGAGSAAEVRRVLLAPAAAALVVAAAGFGLGVRNTWTLLTLGFGGYAAQVTLAEMLKPARLRAQAGEAWGAALAALPRGGTRRRFGGYVVHAAVVVIVIAIAVSSTMGESREVQLRQGESVALGRYTLTFLRAEEKTEPHRHTLAAVVGVSANGRDLGVMRPAMNQYGNQREPVGTPAVRSSWREDLYLSALNIDPRGGSVGLHALVNPMVAWIWGATAVLGLGGLLGLVPARRPRTGEAPVRSPAPAAAGSVP